MPVYLHIFNLVLDKKSVIEKYQGGINQFRLDYNIPFSEINQEDDELFSLGQINADQFDIDSLVSKGIQFDNESQTSNDFTIVYRNGDLFWDVKWLKHNKVFAWHINASPELQARVAEISNMTMDNIVEQMENGNNLLKAIRH